MLINNKLHTVVQRISETKKLTDISAVNSAKVVIVKKLTDPNTQCE